jgi:phosphoglycolate phosphatase-like HAD superfamily hydrolase
VSPLKAVLFDVDGVLLNSLPAHLKICEDKNREYGLGLTIPGPAELSAMVRRGVRIGPMKYFFEAVGFPEDRAEQATRDYERIFAKEYAPPAFPDVDTTLRTLHQAGLQLGVVTSNVVENITGPLAASMQFFRRDCIYSVGDGSPKSEAIVSALAKINSTTLETLYVGDQPSDRKAAEEAKVHFLGVSYGWGVSKDETSFPVVNSVREIAAYILSHWSAPGNGM